MKGPNSSIKSELVNNETDSDEKNTEIDGENNEGYVENQLNVNKDSPTIQNDDLAVMIIAANGSKQVNGHSHRDIAENLSPTSAASPIVLYKIRWLVLLLFVLYSMSNAFQWIQYAIITNLISKYYGVDEAAVNWTSMIYMVAYIPLIFPATMLLDKRGLRFVVIIGSFGTALGAWIKCASVRPDLFYVTMIGQTVSAISQIFVLNIPPRLAAVWFGAREVSTACSIGVFGNQFGVALGFLLPPIIVPDSTSDAIGDGLAAMFYGVAGFSTLLFFLILIVFKNEPPTPPSPAAAGAKIQLAKNENYLLSICRLFKDKSYMLLLISYGINTGVYYAVSTLLNQQFLQYFEGDATNAGRVGLTIVVSGMVGSVVCGLWLDKTHRFKETALAVYVFSLVGMIAYTFIFKTHLIWAVFAIAGFLGFFMTGYLPVGFEFAAEITYPESEGTSSGLLNASSQIFGIVCTIAAGEMMKSSDILSNLVMSGLLVVGAFMTVFVKANLKRTAAQRQLTNDGLSYGKDSDEELSDKPNGVCEII